jgi:hypothetical protein
MPADGSGAIGPVSVRYAAQIRELLYAQAVQRMAADHEAARAKTKSERAEKDEAAAKSDHIRQPLAARVEAPEAVQLAAPTKLPEAAESKPAAPSTGIAKLVDIHA